MTSRLLVDKIEGKTTANTVQMPSGSVLQVVSSEHSSETSTTSTSFVDTGHSLTITPKFSTSKVLITLMGGRMTYGTVNQISVNILASINGGSYADVILAVDLLTMNSTYGLNMASQKLHSPNTTGAVIYKTQFGSGNGAEQLYTSSSCVVTLTAMEISQ
jgi:hypothetical protein